MTLLKHAKDMSQKRQNEPDYETIDFSKPDFEFKPNEYHDWRQQGVYLVCKSCELTHAVYIGPNKLMVGINDKGQPILKDRKPVSKHANA